MAERRLDPAQWACDGDLRDALAVTAPLAPVTAEPDAEAPMTSQLLFGEGFTVRARQTGWAFGQGADGYVGWVPDVALGAAPAATHRVSALNAILYSRPDIKSRPLAAFPFAAQMAAEAAEDGWLEMSMGGFLPAIHAAPLARTAPDWVATAARFLGAPYLWGGRSAAGIDCSGLVQIARQAAGLDCPRDSDMQRDATEADIPENALERGDLVFWKGHVGVMLSATRLLHANAHHMAVAVEPLKTAAARIETKGEGPILARRRWTSI